MTELPLMFDESELGPRMGPRRGHVATPGSGPPGQGWVHYDISMSARVKAVAHGAVEITVRELGMKCASWRQSRSYAAAAEQGRMQALAARNGKGDAC